MIESIFDFCLQHIVQIEFIEFIDRLIIEFIDRLIIEFIDRLIIEFIDRLNFINRFEVIDIQTDDTLILADDEFVTLEENELARAHLTFKRREKLNLITSIKFNDELIILVDNDNILNLTQSKQFDQIRLIDVKISIDLTSSRDEIRKMITSKDQYVAQRAKETYIVIVSQSKTSFDFFLNAQIINSKEDNAKRLNQRL
jgi:acetolactate synthase small subunit